MTQENEMRRLETLVKELLTGYSTLKAEKIQLLQELLKSELMVKELRNTTSSNDMERDEIFHRVNKIIEQIEDWEANLDDAVDTGGGFSTTNDLQEDNELRKKSMERNEAITKDGQLQKDLFPIVDAKD